MLDFDAKSERDLMSGAEMRRALARMAHEIIERNQGAENLLIAGIPTRGVHIGDRLAELIQQYESILPSTSILDTTWYRDDGETRSMSRVYAERSNGMDDVDVSGMKVVIVDDVFHTGRTARAALDALMKSGRPSNVQLAVLINRGHRELPISPDFVGRNLPTSRSERVFVRLQEVDGEDRVAIARIRAKGTVRAG